MKQLKPELKHPRLWLALLAIIIFAPLLFIGFLKMNSFYKDHYIQTNVPVSISFKPIFEIKEKEEPKIVEKTIQLPEPQEVDTPLKKFICEQFGPMDCKIALSVAQAESGFREDAININTNNTVDIGIFQINSIHYSKPGCSLKEVVIEEKNVICAVSIWKASGWGAWSSVNNGSFLAHLDK